MIEIPAVENKKCDLLKFAIWLFNKKSTFLFVILQGKKMILAKKNSICKKKKISIYEKNCEIVKVQASTQMKCGK